jgi:predicted kinase
MAKNLIIVRGLPGSGKSTIGAKFGVAVRSADDFFMFEGEYLFDPSKIVAAHAACQKAVKTDLSNGDIAVVANTFCAGWEFTPYIKIAEDTSSVIIVVDLFDGGMDDSGLAARNVHGVSAAVIAAMRARWEADWRSADPRPPWERG